MYIYIFNCISKKNKPCLNRLIMKEQTMSVFQKDPSFPLTRLQWSRHTFVVAPYSLIIQVPVLRYIFHSNNAGRTTDF